MSEAGEFPTQMGGMEVRVLPDATAACRLAADRIEEAIAEARSDRGRAVLGLATGTTPETVYARLVERHEAGACRSPT